MQVTGFEISKILFLKAAWSETISMKLEAMTMMTIVQQKMKRRVYTRIGLDGIGEDGIGEDGNVEDSEVENLGFSEDDNM